MFSGFLFIVCVHNCSVQNYTEQLLNNLLIKFKNMI